MDMPIIAIRPGIFNFLELPSELRNRIYQLHLSKEGNIEYPMDEDVLGPSIYDKPLTKPIMGINILRVCRQIYNEAITYAYTNRRWSLGGPFTCAERLTHIPSGTVEKIQRLRLNVANPLYASSPVVSVTVGDVTKMKSLKSLELVVVLCLEWVSHHSIPYCDSTLLVGLVCQILSQIPTQVEVSWTPILEEWRYNERDELGAAMEAIAHKFAAIKGCDCAADTSSAAST
jgi:hypothetical protein